MLKSVRDNVIMKLNVEEVKYLGQYLTECDLQPGAREPEAILRLSGADLTSHLCFSRSPQRRPRRLICHSVWTPVLVFFVAFPSHKKLQYEHLFLYVVLSKRTNADNKKRFLKTAVKSNIIVFVIVHLSIIQFPPSLPSFLQQLIVSIMARSKEALQRRAEKRNRTMEEQRKKDAQEIERQIEQRNKKQKKGEASLQSATEKSTVSVSTPSSSNPKATDFLASNSDERNQHLAISSRKGDASEEDWNMLARNNRPGPTDEQKEILQEPGSWICHSCGNHNFPSRRFCYSKACDVRRPGHLDQTHQQGNNRSTSYARPGRNSNRGEKKTKNQKPQRHDPETSKQLDWAPNAPRDAINKNMELRKRYQETNGEGMTPEDIARAKLLLERDERKRARKDDLKLKKNKLKQNEDGNIEGGDTAQQQLEAKEDAPSEDTKQELKSLSKQIRKENKNLRKLYTKTSGVGMSEDDVERAKILMERDERKKRNKEAKLAAIAKSKQ